MKLGMAKFWREVYPYWKAQNKQIEPILQVHDEMILWLNGFTPADKRELDAQIRACMYSSAPPNFRIPLDAGNGYATTWAELEH